jgi:nitrite reductase (NADH) small subunit
MSAVQQPGLGSATDLIDRERVMPRLDRRWRVVCDVSFLTPDRGASARVGGDRVAVFRLSSGELRAIDDFDPFSGAYVLSRGIVGDADGEPTVASPVYKQRFSLRTGVCLDDPTGQVGTWEVRLNRGRIEVAVP